MNDRQSKQFDAMARNGNLLKMLIDELLDVSAASTGKLRLQFERVTAERVIAEAVQIVTPMTESRNQGISVQITEPELQFTGDPGRLQQVIANLLSNASKYSPGHSEITVEVTNDEEQVHFKIKDQGIGISASDQQRLFSTFFRSDAAMASGEPGTGLGLVIVRSIVEGHGGSVRIESAIGSGTTAYVDLPLNAVQSQLSETDEATDSAA